MRDGQEFGYKTVVEEPEVSEAIIKHSKTVHRLEEAYMALCDYLSHDGQGIRGSVRIIDKVTYYMFVQEADRLAGTPRLTVIYKITDTQIVITKLYID
jgi:hypothetical protein